MRKIRHKATPLAMPAIAIFIVMALALFSCTSINRDDSLAKASAGGFSRHLFHTSTFTIFGLLKPGTNDRLRVYVEGDGRAWLSRTKPSSDPTPTNPIALDLARNDHSADHVLYLARPCQYVSGQDRRNCGLPKGRRYWTDARLAPEVIASLGQAIDEAKRLCGARRITLTGFSGGGGACVLLAARRDDVDFLGTVAGNLDTAAWTRLLRVSPLAGSLNPADFAASIQRLPQRHLSSHDDSVMPPQISAGFCQAAGRPDACQTINGLQHSGPWQDVWNYEY